MPSSRQSSFRVFVVIRFGRRDDDEFFLIVPWRLLPAGAGERHRHREEGVARSLKIAHAWYGLGDKKAPKTRPCCLLPEELLRVHDVEDGSTLDRCDEY